MRSMMIINSYIPSTPELNFIGDGSYGDDYSCDGDYFEAGVSVDAY